MTEREPGIPRGGRPGEATGRDAPASTPGPAGADAPASTPGPAGVDTPASSPQPAQREQGLWGAYWERFRRQQVDDPIEERREGYWDRFRRQDVDDPVDRRRT